MSVLWSNGEQGLLIALLSLASSTVTSEFEKMDIDTYELGINLPLNVHRRPFATFRCFSQVNPETLNSMRPVHFGRRMRYKMGRPALDPRTTHNCLFMCLSHELQ
eukprot:2083662-Amphidinium_carterae.1